MRQGILARLGAWVPKKGRDAFSTATSPAKADQIKEAFIGMGYNVRVLPEDQLEKEFED
jgi:hypothetical protein